MDFYHRPTLVVARELLGCRLVRHEADGTHLSGIITETEAYIGENDLACHARMGKTRRNAPMYGRPGTAYLYFIYGAHWCFNIVTEAEEYPAAVLIRAIEIVEGAPVVASRRAKATRKNWTNGPAKLTSAFHIQPQLNECDLTKHDSGLWLEAGEPIPDQAVTIGPRVGLYSVPEPWKSIPWRFLARLT